MTLTYSFLYNFDHNVTNRTYDPDKNNNNDSREGGTYRMAALTTTLEWILNTALTPTLTDNT